MSGTSVASPINLLPPELLAFIFECHQSNKDELHSFDDILLVCKSWTRIALDFPAIWRRIRIRIEHPDECRKCLARAKSYLQRCKGVAGVEVDIEVPPCGLEYADHYYSHGNGWLDNTCIFCTNPGGEEYLLRILDVLKSLRESNDQHWRLRIGNHSWLGGRTMELHRYLGSLPAFITHLSLTDMTIDANLVQNCHSLISVQLIDAQIDDLPDLSDVRYLELDYRQEVGGNIQNLRGLENAQKLETLSIRMPLALTPVFLPPIILHSVRHFSLDILTFPPWVIGIQFPSLVHLEVTLSTPDARIEDFMSGVSNIPFHQLKKFEYFSSPSSPSRNRFQFAKFILSLLARCDHLEEVGVNGELPLWILKTVYEDRLSIRPSLYSIGSLSRRPFTLIRQIDPAKLDQENSWVTGSRKVPSINDDYFQLSGVETAEEILKLAREKGLSLDVTWDSLEDDG